MKWLLLLAAMVLVTAISDGKTLIVDPTERGRSQDVNNRDGRGKFR